MKVPLAIPECGNDEIEEVAAVIRSGWLTTASRCAKFEKDFAEFTGVRHALAVNSATADLASIKYRNEEEILADRADPEKFYVEEILPEKLNLAKRYIESISFKTDMQIILQTIKSIMRC